ncbi:isocitrate/isopropylmalate dehydrogenase family protein, partial [bacterium]|nr:isocitrate/isopropylmalate dehydrogenase family protein [bacterium]
DKANVLPSMAFFRKIFDERAARFPDIETERAYVDATALNMVRCPWKFDVMVMENMYGDILSDLGAGLIGGMGMAPSADIGDEHAVFQPCHGSAPDIAGSGKANPTAMILSGAMLLEWLGDTHNDPACAKASALITEAVDRAFAGSQLRTCEFGGESGTQEIAEKVLENLERL